MFFYLSLLILSTSFAFCYSKAKNSIVAISFKYLCFLSFFIPAALRFGIGVDYFTYERIFKHISNGVPILVEPGYWYINHLVYKYGGSFQVVVAIMAFFTLYFMVKSFPKKYYHYCIPLLILVIYNWTYTTIRQMLVVSIAYYCYTKFFTKKKYIHCFGILVFATLFHLSAFLYIPLFIILLFVKVNRIQAFMLFFLIILLLPFSNYIIHSIFEPLLSATKYGVYFSLDSQSGKAPEITTGIGRLIRFISYGVILLPIIKHRKISEASNSLILFLIVVLFDVLSQEVMVFTRISRGLLFSYFMVFLITVEGKSRYRKIILMTNYLLLLILYIGNLRNGVNVPYTTIFQ